MKDGASSLADVAVTYYGHDASVIVSSDVDGAQVTTRVASHMATQQGAKVWLGVEKDPMAYPLSALLVGTEALVTTDPQPSPKGALVRTIEEIQQ